MPPTAAAVIVFLLCFFLRHSSAETPRQHRRILHQPLFPEDPPSPTSPPIPKYPFSSTTPDNTPFFPINTSPPAPVPQTPASYGSFPADVPSLPVLHSKSKSAPRRLAVAAVAAVIAAVAVVSIAIFVHIRRRGSGGALSENEVKTQRSDDSSSTANASRRPPNRQHIPKLQRASHTSSEFLYLGTLVNSHPGEGGIDFSGSISGVNDDTQSRTTESPELHPLPPLNPPQSLRRNYRSNADAKSSRDDQDEEFYSPRGSLGVESSIATVSASPRVFSTIPVENLNGSTSISSSTYSSTASGSGLGSPERSGSLSLSPENSLSPKNSMPKSPDLIEIQNIAPPHRHSTRPQGITSKESASSSPPSSSSPGGYSRRSVESSPRISSSSDHNTESSVRISCLPDQNPTVSLPSHPKIILSPPSLTVPPPPPPPPPAFRRSENPKTPSLLSKKHVPDPPALITPLRGITVESPVLISPIELPLKDFHTVKEHLGEGAELDEETTPRPKLKPLHWDKVRASSDREMVWDQLKSSSFKLNEEMIETLFVANVPKPTPKEQIRWQVLPSPGPDSGDRVLDPKKAQNISILLKALNVTVEEVCEGLLEGNTESLGTELLESLLKMAPTKEEERKLKDYKEVSPGSLGAAERFLKAVLDIPYAFKRVEAMLYVSNFESEVDYLRKSCTTLEAACEELRTSRMFLKILEAVLKTGNRMNVGTNRGDAHAFKLDTLLKLVDVKGADGKTTLLHFVVQEIIRSEGVRLSENPTINDDTKCKRLGLQVVSGLSSELSDVKKAATMDAEVLNSDLAKLTKGIVKIQEVVRLITEMSLDHKFCDSMHSFMQKAEEDIIRIQAQESVALSLVKEITEYFHGNSAKEEAHPFRIFMVVRDFLTNLDCVCKEVGIINERKTISSSHKFPVPVNPMLQQASMGFLSKKQQQHSSSGEDSS